MIIGKALFFRLTGDTAVNGIVAGRVTPNVAEQIGKTYPLIVYEGDGEEIDKEYAGSSGLVTQTVKIMSAATAYPAADDLATKVRQALDDGSGTWAGVVIQGCFFESQEETEEHDSDTGAGSLIYVIEQTYTIFFTQPS